MSTLKPPLACNHIPAQPGWYAVFDAPLPDGGIELYSEVVLAWRLETFQVEHARGDRFDQITPVIASGSVCAASVYVLQFGGAWFTGDERFDTKDEVIAWFRKQRAVGIRR